MRVRNEDGLKIEELIAFVMKTDKKPFIIKTCVWFLLGMLAPLLGFLGTVYAALLSLIVHGKLIKQHDKNPMLYSELLFWQYATASFVFLGVFTYGLAGAQVGIWLLGFSTGVSLAPIPLARIAYPKFKALRPQENVSYKAIIRNIEEEEDGV